MALKNTDKSILLLFTDASVNPISKIGYGAYLVLDKHIQKNIALSVGSTQ